MYTVQNQISSGKMDSATGNKRFLDYIPVN